MSAIILVIKPSDPSRSASSITLANFSSYSFDRDITIPSSPFRFTAEGVDRSLRQKIRSTDMVELFIRTEKKIKFGNVIDTFPLATGYIDETDIHVSSHVSEFSITGRDTLGQLVDNAAVDSNNQIVHVQQISMYQIAKKLASNTRIPSDVFDAGTPTGSLMYYTNPQETKISAMQRYLEYTNCLVWSLPGGQMMVGKPNMSQRSAGNLTMKHSDPSRNNLTECRSRRNVNMAIRQIAIQQQSQSIIDPTAVTIQNMDEDVQAASNVNAGKSVYSLFTLSNGMDSVNNLTAVGGGGAPQQIGFTMARRQIAASNMHVLDVECVVKGHLNEQGVPYNIDQVYHVNFEDDQIDQDMYVYAVRYELSPQHGLTTNLKLSKLGTIVADIPTKE